MDVFISWSGESSKKVAEFLCSWLRKFPLNIVPWVSGEAIDAGTRWTKELDEALKETNFGIFCLTKDNQINPWICFEAGALAKAIEKANVVPYLINITAGELEYPLKLFQAINANKDDTLRLIKTIHKSSSDKTRSEADLTEVFEKWWPELEIKIESAKKEELSDVEVIKGEPSLTEIKAAIDKIFAVVESLSSRLVIWGSKSHISPLSLDRYLKKLFIKNYLDKDLYKLMSGKETKEENEIEIEIEEEDKNK